METRNKIALIALPAVLATAALGYALLRPSPETTAATARPPLEQVMKELEKARAPSRVDAQVRSKDWAALDAELAVATKTEDALGQLIRITETEKLDPETNEGIYRSARAVLAAKPSAPRVIVLATRLFGKLGPTAERLKELEKLYAAAQKPEAAKRSWMEVALAARPFPKKAGKTLDALLKSKNAGEVREGLYFVSQLSDAAAKKDFEARVVRGYFRAPAAAQPFLYKEIFSSFKTPPAPQDARKLKDHARLQKSEIWDDVRKVAP